MTSKAKNLAKTLGGEWTYDGISSWWCSDGIRHVARCSAGVDEFDNPLGPPEYWLYTKSQPPMRAEGFICEVQPCLLWERKQ